MVAWAAVIPAIKAALPVAGKAIGAMGATKSLGGMFGGEGNSPEGSGITYNAQIYGGQVPTVGNNNLYSRITGQGAQQPSFYDRLVN